MRWMTWRALSALPCALAWAGAAGDATGERHANHELPQRESRGGHHGKGVIGNKHSTDVEYSPPSRVCMGVHPEDKSCTDLGLVLVLNDPAAWGGGRRRQACTGPWWTPPSSRDAILIAERLAVSYSYC